MGGKPRVSPSRLQEPLREPLRESRARVRAVVRVSSAGGGTPLYVDAPRPFCDAVAGDARVAVRGRLGGAAFTGAVIPLGGRRRLVITRALADAAGVFDGARVSIELEEID